MDDTLRHLLLALAETLDPSVLPVLADRLEELGDGRAGEVRALAHGRPARVGAAYNGWGSAEWDWRVGEQGLADCHKALNLFPEGPRWRARIHYPYGQGTTCIHTTPSYVRAHGESLRGANDFTVEGPLWPELTPPPPRH